MFGIYSNASSKNMPVIWQHPYLHQDEIFIKEGDIYIYIYIYIHMPANACYYVYMIICMFFMCAHFMYADLMMFFIPPEQRSCWGHIGFTPSVRPSVRLSRLPCPLCNIYSSGWILSILATNDHYHKRVCRTQWPLTLTYIVKVILPWLRKSCPLCSVYSSGWILFIFGTNDYYHKRVCRVLSFFFQNLKILIFGKFLKIFSLDLEKKNLQFSMDSFHF